MTAPADAATVVSGGGHSCAIARSGSVICWGANASGQLGDGSTTASSTPVIVPSYVPESLDVTALSAGAAHSCALVVDGTVQCWGENGAGQLGDGTTADSSSPLTVVGVSDAVQIAAGAAFTCALLADGTVKCWGEGSSGQLGDGLATDSGSPVTVSSLTNASHLTAGDEHVCVVASGAVRCWGANASGQLGDGTIIQRNAPVSVSGVSGVTMVSGGTAFSCALTAANVKCWGANASGQLGDGTTVSPRTTAVTVAGLSSPSRVAAGGAHACAVDSTPALKCWGANASGQLGDASTTASSSPVAVSGLTDADALSASSNHTCALTATGGFYCWGAGSNGEIGDGGSTDRSTPATVRGTAGGKTIANGSSHTCVALSGGKVNCWGANAKGQLGDTSTSTATTPVVAFNLFNLTGISAGFAHSCAIESGGQAKCWGDNQFGQVGSGNSTAQFTMANSVSGLSNATLIDTGLNFSCAVTTAAQAKCWGQNGNYQLGDGTTTNRNAPVTVSGLSNVTAISGGGTTTCAIVSGGQAKCWGNNAAGQVGQGNTNTPVTAPANVSSLTDAVAIANGQTHACAIVTGGAVECWGSNDYGQLGDGTNTQRTTPVSVSGVTGATAIAAGDYHTCALVVLGAVKCWGFGTNGRLGNGGTSNSNVPVDVSGLLGAVSLSGGGQHTCAVVAGGNTYCWGYGLNGQLGNGSTADRLVPYEAEKVLEGLIRITTLSEGLFTQSTQPSIGYSTLDVISPLVECNLDGAGYSSCSFPPFTPGSPLSVGRHTMRIKAAPNFLGNDVISYTSLSFAVSVVLPTATISSPVESAQTADSTPSMTFSATGEGALTTECRADSGSWAACSSPWTSGALADGAHSLELRVTDANTNTATASVNIVVDTVMPDTTITASPASLSNVTAPSFSFSANEAGSTFQCRIDAGSWNSCTSAYGLVLAAGSHTFDVRAIDQAGNTDATPASYSWTIDTTPPNTLITANPATLTTSTGASFSFTATETATFQCQLDGGGYGACTSPRNYTSLTDGSHTFDVRATDTAGNLDSTPASYSWTIDTTPPNTSITANPATLTTSTGASFSFTATETATFQCQLDGGGYSTCTSPRSYTSLADGSHTFMVRATDTAGNADATPASYTWTVDTTPPNTSITSNPASLTNSTGASFSFTATETATFQCQLDGGGYGACTSPRNYTSLTDGSHTFDVRATDTAGNVDATPASYSWTVDTTVPDTSITVNPAALTTSTDASFSFTATEVATFQCQLDGGGYGACTSPRGYTSLADGSHTFMVRASDAAGNTDATPASVTWTIDTAAPNTTITSNPAALSGSTGASFSFTATETATFQCQLDGGGYGSCTSPRVYSSLADGSHTFDVRATDTAGNTDATLASYGWTIDATVPNVQITSPAGGSTLGDTTPDVSFTASDANGVTVECKTDGGPWTACGSPYTTPALADGAHVVSVRALDPAGNEGSAAVNFTVDATFPTVSITTPASGLATSDATPTIGFTANGSGALTVECKVDSGAFAACTSGGSLATLADGQHTLTVRVTDPLARVVTADRTFTVDTSAPAINFASPANGAVAQGPALDVSFGVSDATSVSLTCSVDSSPPAACSSPFSTGALSDGPHGVTVNMVDAAGNVAAGNVNFTIDSTAPALTIGSPSAGATVTTAVATVVFGATDSTAVSYQCAVDGGSPQPCASPYVPAIAAGSRTVTVYAFDAAGNSTSQVLNFTFAPPAPAPDASPSTPPVGGAQTYSATLTAKKKAGKLRLSLKLTPPAGVSAACAGTVSFSGKMLRVKVGGTAVLKSVAGACVAMRVAKVKKTLKGKLKLTATFAGSAQIAPVKTSKTFKVK